MTLNNWSVISKLQGIYGPPAGHLTGEVIGHPSKRWPDGSSILTSRIVGKVGNSVVTQTGSVYNLGVVDPIYEALYTNAKERLLRSLNEV